MSSFEDEAETALSEFLSLHMSRSEYLAAITAAHERGMEQFVEAVKQGISTESCYKHSPVDGNPMLHHQQVYDELDWQHARIKGEA